VPNYAHVITEFSRIGIHVGNQLFGLMKIGPRTACRPPAEFFRAQRWVSGSG
jgi:hypothetical protein